MRDLTTHCLRLLIRVGLFYVEADHLLNFAQRIDLHFPIIVTK